MTTINIKFRNPVAWLTAVCCLALLIILTGCSTLQSFSGLEEKALENGTISVGAVRVTDYNSNELQASRKVLRNTLDKLERDINEMSDANFVPQYYGQELTSKFITASMIFALPIKIAIAAPNTPAPEPNMPHAAALDIKDTGDYFKNLSDIVNDLITKERPRPSVVELAKLRMSSLKYIESEKEDLNLCDVSPVDSNYRRYVVSLDFTAWVRGKAKAALVYIDLYPYRADTWCRAEAYDVLSKNTRWDVNNQIVWDEFNKRAWDENLYELKKGIDPGFLESLPAQKAGKGDTSYYIAKCHTWLEDKHLRPRIIQVERMSPGEYSVRSKGDFAGVGLQAEMAYAPLGSANIKGENTRKSEGIRAEVEQFSVAFVAGAARAGWLFMPKEGKMPPTERRLRMVVDVPKNMTKLGIHVHKVFLDADLHIIPDTDFAHQMDDLKNTRDVLDKSELLYEQYETSPVLYRLIKTRIRNLLYQGWSEEIVADIPSAN